MYLKQSLILFVHLDVASWELGKSHESKIQGVETRRLRKAVGCMKKEGRRNVDIRKDKL